MGVGHREREVAFRGGAPASVRWAGNLPESASHTFLPREEFLFPGSAGSQEIPGTLCVLPRPFSLTSVLQDPAVFYTVCLCLVPSPLSSSFTSLSVVLPEERF